MRDCELIKADIMVYSSKLWIYGMYLYESAQSGSGCIQLHVASCRSTCHIVLLKCGDHFCSVKKALIFFDRFSLWIQTQYRYIKFW